MQNKNSVEISAMLLRILRRFQDVDNCNVITGVEPMQYA